MTKTTNKYAVSYKEKLDTLWAWYEESHGKLGEVTRGLGRPLQETDSAVLKLSEADMTFGSTFGRTFSPTFQPKSQAAAVASAFVPTDIAGLAQWLYFSDANTLYTDAGTTKVSSDGDAIYQANDKSGNNKHATQTTAGYRPLYKTGIQNSKSIARFDGSDDYLLPNTNEIEGSAWTLFISFKSTSSSGALYISGRYDVTFTSSKYGCGCAIYSGAYGIASVSSSGLQYSVTNTTYTNWNIATFKAKTSENEIFVNGASIGTPSPPLLQYNT